MANINIRATSICAGGNHVTITATIGTGASRSWVFLIDELREAINDDSNRKPKEVILDLIALHSIGKTVNQLKSDLQAGFTVTV